MAYSIDLRQKIVKRYQSGDISQANLATLFDIGISTVKRYLKLDREKGDLSPCIEGRGRPALIHEEGFKTIQKLIAENPSITLQELSDSYYKVHKIKTGRSVLSRACQQLGLSRKKFSIYAAERNRDDIKKKDKIILKK